MYAVLLLLAATVMGIKAVNDDIFYPFGDSERDFRFAYESQYTSIPTGFPFMNDNQSTAVVSSHAAALSITKTTTVYTVSGKKR